MGLIGGSGGTDLLTYTNLSKEITFANSLTSNAYTTAFSINGKGYISQILAYGDGLSNGVRITVDGTVIFECYGVVQGFLLQEYIQQGSPFGARINMTQVSSSNFVIKDTLIIDSTLSTVNGVCLITFPIFFNSSLLIETRHANGGNNSHVNIKGGIK